MIWRHRQFNSRSRHAQFLRGHRQMRCRYHTAQAEIEHFVNPDDKRHPKFGNIAELQPLLYSRAMQMGK